jgi:hypothetical protein
MERFERRDSLDSSASPQNDTMLSESVKNVFDDLLILLFHVAARREHSQNLKQLDSSAMLLSAKLDS